jgi:hypothetical protein
MSAFGFVLMAAFIAILTLGDYDLARRLHRANREKAELTEFNDRLCRRLVVLEKERVDYGIAPDDITALMDAVREETTPLHDAVVCDQFESQFEEES